MKRFDIFKTILASFMAVAMLASCTKENGNGNGDGNGDGNGGGKDEAVLTSIEVKCLFETSEDMAGFFDLKTSYSLNGETVEPVIHSTKIVEITKVYEKDELPEKIAFEVVMSPKAEHEPIDPDHVYTFLRKHQMTVVGTNSNGVKAELKSSGNQEKLSMKGSKLEEILLAGDRKGCSHLYESK